MEEETKIDLNIKIKQEKLSPERKPTENEEDELDKILNSKIFSETDEKKDLEPAKTSDELLQELFGVIGYSGVDVNEIFNDSDKKKKKKKKRKHDDSEDEKSSKKSKKSKKEKKIKKESDRDKKDESKKIKKEKEEITERREVSIVIKDTKYKSEVKKPSRSSSKHKDKDKSKDDKKRKERSSKDEKKRERRRSEKESSDISLSDEETYRKHYEYHMSSRWDKESRDNRNIRDWDRDKRRYDRSRDSRDRYSRHYRHSRSRSRSSRGHTPIDKKRLLEIARKNAISMLKSGTLPRISSNAKEKLMAKIRHGGKTIEELTNYCKKLSRAEDIGELSDLSDSEIDGEGQPRAFHHPFEVKDRGPIVMNIKNSIPIAPKPASELKAIMAQFPVSSGKQHQQVENTWVPVTTSTVATVSNTTTSTTSSSTTATKQIMTLQKQIQEQLPELAKPKPLPPPPAPPLNPVLSRPYDWKSDDHYCKTIFPTLAPPPEPNCDVSEIISQRLNAMRKLQENPHDVEASKTLYETQQNMSAWAASKVTPGQFLGTTEVRVLSQKELSSGNQAWAKKNQLIETVPVNSGMGMHLLKKMGWTPGEGLGKEKNGSLTPLLLELKLDKRGLEANAEVLRQNKAAPGKARGGGRAGRGGGGNKQQPISMDSLQQKHPVSLLGELASKRRWGAPNYQLVSEVGPPHAKNFIFKVLLNGNAYTCPTPSNNKKEGKSAVAKFCLQELGILPS
ncbi:protein Son [Chironomus tepperi]|uniref:protein Son n=1 Tax=Chironomus tepperi TaxID=113505 RepID=UPI00391F6AA0